MIWYWIAAILLIVPGTWTKPNPFFYLEEEERANFGERSRNPREARPETFLDYFKKLQLAQSELSKNASVGEKQIEGVFRRHGLITDSAEITESSNITSNVEPLTDDDNISRHYTSSEELNTDQANAFRSRNSTDSTGSDERNTSHLWNLTEALDTDGRNSSQHRYLAEEYETRYIENVSQHRNSTQKPDVNYTKNISLHWSPTEEERIVPTRNKSQQHNSTEKQDPERIKEYKFEISTHSPYSDIGNPFIYKNLTDNDNIKVLLGYSDIVLTGSSSKEVLPFNNTTDDTLSTIEVINTTQNYNTTTSTIISDTRNTSSNQNNNNANATSNFDNDSSNTEHVKSTNLHQYHGYEKVNLPTEQNNVTIKAVKFDDGISGNSNRSSDYNSSVVCRPLVVESTTDLARKPSTELEMFHRNSSAFKSINTGPSGQDEKYPNGIDLTNTSTISTTFNGMGLSTMEALLPEVDLSEIKATVSFLEESVKLSTYFQEKTDEDPNLILEASTDTTPGKFMERVTTERNIAMWWGVSNSRGYEEDEK